MSSALFQRRSLAGVFAVSVVYLGCGEVTPDVAQEPAAFHRSGDIDDADGGVDEDADCGVEEHDRPRHHRHRRHHHKPDHHHHHHHHHKPAHHDKHGPGHHGPGHHHHGPGDAPPCHEHHAWSEDAAEPCDCDVPAPSSGHRH